MFRVSAKYNASSAKADQPVAGGEVIGYAQVKTASTRILDLSEGLLRKAKFRKQNPAQSRSFTVSLTHGAHDVHGLKEHGQEAEGFTTHKAVKRTARLNFDSASDAVKAHNIIVDMDTQELKVALQEETLASKLAEQLGLKEENPKAMREPNFQVALFPSHFVAS